MITRGIITNTDSNQIRVYVPILDGYVPEEELTTSYLGTEARSIVATPGI